jgi:hypothetical protein
MLTSFIIGVLLLYGVCGWLHRRKTNRRLLYLFMRDASQPERPFELD